MQLREMLDEIRYTVGDKPETTELITMLNRTMVRIARDMRFPQYHEEFAGITDQFDMPANAIRNGLLEVRRQPNATRLDILTTSEAHKRYPGWEDWTAGDTLFVVYDPKMNGLNSEIRPVPLPESGDTETYLITYIAEPAEMDELTDEPFDGHLPEYHEVLVHYTIYQILLRVGDERRQEFYAHYDRLASEMFTSLRPEPVRARNPLYEGIMDATY